MFSSLLDVDPYWIGFRKQLRNGLAKAPAWIRSEPGVDQLSRWADQATRPLPGSPATGWWPTGDRAAWLLAIATNAEPWVPTQAVSTEVYAHARRAVRVPNDGGNLPVREQVARSLASINAHSELINA